MADIVNLITIQEGATISTISGATAEVVNNPKDGVWVFVKYLTSPEEPELVGTEDMIFAPDIAEVLPGE
jgi:ABC-type glycerol-3-phosphate transport system substrate-binding protein